MIQADLDFSKGRDNPNSAAAHAKLRPSKALARREVWLAIYDSGKLGMTLEQIGDMVGKPPSAISGRCTELAALGMIWRASSKGVTKSGNSCSVWLAR